tara:strand:- start:107 stop:343 length:237 start_codon:yes stop_codon:yes gene_type:complete
MVEKARKTSVNKEMYETSLPIELLERLATEGFIERVDEGNGNVKYEGIENFLNSVMREHRDEEKDIIRRDYPFGMAML